MIALITAAMIPTTPPNTPRMLNIPPRLAGERANRIPIAPITIATPARSRPKNAPTLKLKIAAMTARIEGMLKAALEVSFEFMELGVGAK